MSNHEFEDAGAAAASSRDDDLSKFLLGRLALQTRELEIDKLFRALVKLEGSDLHMRVGSPPMVRTKGELRALNREPVDAEEMVRLLVPMLDERARESFAKKAAWTSPIPAKSRERRGVSV